MDTAGFDCNCIPNAFLEQIRSTHTLPPEINGDCLRLMVVGYLLDNLDKHREAMQEELADDMSLGVWMRRTMNPDLYLGGEFIFLLHEMTKVSFSTCFTFFFKPNRGRK